MQNRERILVALFSALVLLVAVTFAGCLGDDEGEDEKISTDADGMVDEWEVPL